MKLSVIISTLNPHPGRLRRTLQALKDQSLPVSDWECLLVDNASSPALNLADWIPQAPANLRLVREPQPGLSHARQRGILSTTADVLVLVDDDNVLAKDYLAQALELLNAHPRVGTAGGKSLPEFELPPEAWIREFDGLLACRDLGDEPLISSEWPHAATVRRNYPLHAPIGAGMILRRAAALDWVQRSEGDKVPDRQGNNLSSSGDNDLVLCALKAGWETAYFPALRLTHLIPAGRVEPAYLARLNRGIQKSWMAVLTLHAANPWPPLSASGIALRKGKAWFTHQAWRSPAAQIRWQGACGHFEGRKSTSC